MYHILYHIAAHRQIERKIMLKVWCVYVHHIYVNMTICINGWMLSLWKFKLISIKLSSL